MHLSQRTRRGNCAARLGACVVTAVSLALVGATAGQTIGPGGNLEKADQLREDLRQMIGIARDRVFPALVNIKVITVTYRDGKEQKGEATGSGTIISPEGYVLTNYHVVENGRKFTCTLADKQEISAELVGEDPLTDLAVLKLNLGELKDPAAVVPSAKLGDSDELQIGDTVMAMGSPWALSRSVTLGIVSNTERVLASDDDEAPEMRFDEFQRTGIFNRWIQHDAAINPGNSGGPLVNLKGEVVGVNARGMFFGGDMGFAIPADIARKVADELIARGEVPRSWFGLDFRPIKDTGFAHGVLVNSVTAGGPADKAGLRAGDLIVSIDRMALTVSYAEEVPPLLKLLADYPIGSQVAVTYERDGKAATATVTTEKLQADRGDEAAFRGWGFVGMEITPNMARERRLDSILGVLITSVRDGGPAQLAEPVLYGGDVIRAVDGMAIATLADLVEVYKKTMEAEERPESMLFEFDRRGANQVTLLKPRPDEDIDPPQELAKAWIGVAVQPVVKELARQLGHADQLGFRITRVYPKTRAAETNLQVGDVIVALNGDKLRPRGNQDSGLFHREVRKLDMDGTAALTVLRNGQTQEVIVPLERTRLMPEEARRDVNRDFEITVREVTFFDRDGNRWDDTVHGVLVVGTESAGWADQGGLAPGDLIQRIDEFAVTDLDSYRRAMEAVTERKTERIVFVVLRGVRTYFQYVEPEWSPVVTEGPEPKQGEP